MTGRNDWTEGFLKQCRWHRVQNAMAGEKQLKGLKRRKESFSA
jgi:hypothetical protein